MGRGGGDPITALAAGSPLRAAADVADYWLLASPVAFMRWGQQLVDGVSKHGLLRRWGKSTGRDSAAADSGYLADGRHSSAYVTEGHCVRLASAVDEELRTARVYGAFA